MNNGGGNICRFCLKIVQDQNIEIIGDITLEILNVLLIKMDLTIDGNTLICSHCQDSMERCFNFKSTCLYTEDTLVEYITEGSKLNIAEAYLKGNLKSRSKKIPRGHKICRLCMKITGTAKCLNDNNEPMVLINKKLERFIPEVNLHAVQNTVICEACLLGLHSCSDFAAACLDVEKKINRYCAARGVDKAQVQLCNVLQFILTEPEFKDKRKLDEKQPNVGNNCFELSTIALNIVKEEIGLQSEDDGKRDNHKGVVRKATNKNQYYCESCTFNTGNKKLLNRHLITHEVSSDITIYKCEECSFISKYELGLKRHRTKVHRNPPIRREFKCKFCPYKNKHPCQIKQHEVTHKDPSERQKLKCSLCNFQCLKKAYMTTHLKLHTVAPETPWYTCTQCPFKTVHPYSINIHMRTCHDVIPEAELFWCAHCTYKAKTKINLKNHLVSHRDKSEIITFNCKQCPYKGKLQSALRAHMETHKSPDERKSYFEYKNIERRRKAKIARSKNTKTYQCDECTYETKNKYYVPKHKKLLHGDNSDRVLLKCDMCSFQCKSKWGITYHSLSHKSADEIPMYKCLHCPYQTKNKRSLIGHFPVHIDKTLRPKFKCEVCGVQVKSKCALRRHQQVTCQRSKKKRSKNKKTL